MECIPVHHPEVAGACGLVLADVEATHLCAVADHGAGGGRIEHACRCGATWTTGQTTSPSSPVSTS